MSPRTRGLLLAALHAALVLSLGAKLLCDRATRPRVWVRTAPVDPETPFRGRYVSLRLEIPAGGFALDDAKRADVTLAVENDHLVATPAERETGIVASLERTPEGRLLRLDPPVAFFIPEKSEDPSRRKRAEALWAEVTVPKRGPPRPIRLGVKKDGALTPLEF